MKQVMKLNKKAQRKSSSSLTDELESTTDTQFPAWVDVDTRPQGPVILS